MQDQIGKFAINAGKKQIKSQVQKNTTGRFKKGDMKNKPKINWNDFNFPPKLDLFHLTLSELRGDYHKTTRFLLLAWLLIIIMLPINFINNCIQVVVGYNWSRIPASPLWFFLLIVLAGFIFYWGYRGICEDESYILWHLIGAGLLFFLFFLQTFINLVSWNSLFKVIRIFSDKNWITGLLCAVELLLWMGVISLYGWNFFVLMKWNPDTIDHGNGRSGSKASAAYEVEA